MKLYNTLTRQIDIVKPLCAPLVTVYTCGPTVYDYSHIGHWFNYIRMDILIRTFKISGLKPEWVMNITDVGHLVSDADDGEDKLEKGAKREGKTAWEVAEFYTQDFLECMRLLNISAPDHITKATDHIAEQITLIQRLEAKGYTYVISDGVYYDTSKFEGYAAFARLDLDGIQAGARVSYNSEKRNASDFALWKLSPTSRPAATKAEAAAAKVAAAGDDNPSTVASDDDIDDKVEKKRDMEWDSPWGVGFPGWHIECSAMSMKYLGDTLDIHTGGIDHIPVHHTNEIAQSEAATGKRFANYWMHSNHVMVNGDKISKSLGNGIRLQTLIEQGISAEAVRLHVLESHYRSQSQFSLVSLQAAQNRLKSLQAMAVLRYQTSIMPNDTTTFAMSFVSEQLTTLLTNDLNTPGALAFLSEIENQVSTVLVGKDRVAEFEAMLGSIDAALGLALLQLPDISDTQKTILKERQQARADKDWELSDSLRDKLTEQGIGLRDVTHGAVWRWL